MIETCKILDVTDDEGEIHLLIGIKYTLIVADTVSPIPTTPHSTSLVLCETKVPIQDRGGHTPLSLTGQGRLMYQNFILYSSLGDLNPTPKYVLDVLTYYITRQKYKYTRKIGETIEEHDIPTIW